MTTARQLRHAQRPLRQRPEERDDLGYRLRVIEER